MDNISRRSFLRLSAVGASALTFGFCGCQTNAQKNYPASRPNILFIIADDLGWSDIGYHGSEINTPNLDKLAGEGLKLDQHYVMPTCTPTRVGLMSGRYPSRYGVLSPAYGKIFDKDTTTLPMAMQQAGYRTSIVGKWHMGSPPDYTPMKYGFDQSYGYFHGQIDPYTHLYKDGSKSWHRNDEYLDEEGHSTDLLSDEAIRIINSSGNMPFFLYLAYSVPHSPLDEPEKWQKPYKEIENASRKWFAASVSHMDEGIGRVIDALDKSGKRKETLIVFVSDNGGQQSWSSKSQYKGRYADKPHTVLGNNLPLRGWKGQLYEGGIRVPAFINWKETVKPGKSSTPVHIVDWMPMLCDIVDFNARNDDNCDGMDIFSKIVTNKPLNRTMYWKTPQGAAVRKDNWKLIKINKADKPELYNLNKDPYEKNEVSSQYPEKQSELIDLLKKIQSLDHDRLG